MMKSVRHGKSSNVDAIAYDEETGSLVVRFKSGMSYRYDAVPKHVVQEVERSKSVGSAVNKLIVKGDFKATQIDDRQAAAAESQHRWDCTTDDKGIDMDCDYCADEERKRLTNEAAANACVRFVGVATAPKTPCLLCQQPFKDHHDKDPALTVTVADAKKLEQDQQLFGSTVIEIDDVSGKAKRIDPRTPVVSGDRITIPTAPGNVSGISAPLKRCRCGFDITLNTAPFCPRCRIRL